MSKNDDYTTGSSLDCLYDQNISTLLVQIYHNKNTSIPQQINFLGKLEEYDCPAMFYIAEKLF